MSRREGIPISLFMAGPKQEICQPGMYPFGTGGRYYSCRRRQRQEIAADIGVSFTLSFKQAEGNAEYSETKSFADGYCGDTAFGRRGEWGHA
ncbi:hypothetical protein [Rhizobium sp. R634]|uniref:hypothetical protein n=1 Tax=Rhizobium sp. R634 TaxID=1764274 RepID=UPI00167F11C4|nr:hypothetical protein [Rhizobium sp. R634]